MTLNVGDTVTLEIYNFILDHIIRQDIKQRTNMVEEHHDKDKPHPKYSHLPLATSGDLECALTVRCATLEIRPLS